MAAVERAASVLPRLAAGLPHLPFGNQRRTVRRITRLELLERVAERLAQLEIRLRAEADRRDPRPVNLGSKRVCDLGERIHLGPPLCVTLRLMRQDGRRAPISGSPLFDLSGR